MRFNLHSRRHSVIAQKNTKWNMTNLMTGKDIYRPPLWSSGQSSWLEIQRSGRFPVLPDFLRSSGSGTGPLSLVSTIEELLQRKKSSGSGLESREYGGRDLSRWPRDTLHPQKLALTSPTSGGRSIGIVRSRTQATEVLRTSVSAATYCLMF
jgi:hypothetical protein